MFKCQLCGTPSQPGIPAHKIVLETRATKYPFREKVNACWKWKGDHRKFVRTHDTGGRGRECVREVIACAECAAKFSTPGDPAHSNGSKKAT